MFIELLRNTNKTDIIEKLAAFQLPTIVPQHAPLSGNPQSGVRQKTWVVISNAANKRPDQRLIIIFVNLVQQSDIERKNLLTA